MAQETTHNEIPQFKKVEVMTFSISISLHLSPKYHLNIPVLFFQGHINGYDSRWSENTYKSKASRQETLKTGDEPHISIQWTAPHFFFLKNTIPEN